MFEAFAIILRILLNSETCFLRVKTFLFIFVNFQDSLIFSDICKLSLELKIEIIILVKR